MKSSYELGFALTYVSGWNYTDAVREIFQNALDEETQNNNTMYFNYNEDSETIEIGNKDSTLEVNTLLLGVTSKQDSQDTIGQFGEGYKLALMVLLREGKSVVIYNYGKKEIWTPRIVDSRRYGCKIVRVDVENTVVWKEVPSNNLIIEIRGIAKEEFEEIQSKNLHLYGDYTKIETQKGEILTDVKFKGDIFVKGLFVCHCDTYEYGYNFNPNEIKLDRDRKLVSDWDLKYLASKMWNSLDDASDEVIEIILDMLKNDADDVKHFEHMYDINKNVAKAAYDNFYKANDINAVPVSYMRSRSDIPDVYNRVTLSSALERVITSDDRFEEPKKVMVIEDSGNELTMLREWYEQIEGCLEDHEIEKFEEIYSRLEKRLNS